MNKRVTTLVVAFLMVWAMTVGMTPAFAASSAKAQAKAYNKHSLGLTKQDIKQLQNAYLQ